MQKISNYAQLVRMMASGKIVPPDADTWTCCVDGCSEPIENMNQFRYHLIFQHHFSHGTALQIVNLYNPQVSKERIEGEMQTLKMLNGEG